MIPPPAGHGAEFEKLDLPFAIGSGRTLVSGLGPGSADRLSARFFRRLSDGHVIGEARFGAGAEGPPLHAHGGASAYLLDEAMGTAGWAAGHPVVAARLEFDYKRMVPLDADLGIHAWVEAIQGKRVTIRAELILPSGEVAVSASGTFHKLSAEKIRALFRDLPADVRAGEEMKLTRVLENSEDEKD